EVAGPRVGGVAREVAQVLDRGVAAEAELLAVLLADRDVLGAELVALARVGAPDQHVPAVQDPVGEAVRDVGAGVEAERPALGADLTEAVVGAELEGAPPERRRRRQVDLEGAVEGRLAALRLGLVVAAAAVARGRAESRVVRRRLDHAAARVGRRARAG